MGRCQCGVREEGGHLEDDVSLQQAAVLRRQPRGRHLLDEDLTAQTQAVLCTHTHTRQRLRGLGGGQSVYKSYYAVYGLYMSLD